ncbi:pum [Symbiodinium sp. CCMP2456]|nr:pum [Symbiodinium sp. CCMP2456]
MVPSQQSFGYEQEESTPMPVMWYMVPADQVQQMPYHPVQGPSVSFAAGAAATMTQGSMPQGWWQPPMQMPQMLPLQPVQAAQQVQPTLPLPMQSTQMACPASDIPLEGQCAWGYAGPAPEQCCAPARASAGSVAEVSTAPSEASPRFQEADELSAPMRTSASAARRLRRKRAAERKAKADEEDLARRDAEGLRIRELERGEELAQLQGHVWALSQDKKGCRLVQKALEVAGRETAAIAAELSGHILEAIKHPEANYVVQKAITQLSVGGSGFIVEEIMGSAVAVAKNRMGCRIFCRLLEFCSTNPKVGHLVDELLADVSDLCCHSFAHHVIQSILEHGEERHKHVIAQTLVADVVRFAQHKNTSYLIEKVMTLCTCSEQDQAAMVCALDFKRLLFLAKTQYGRHVAKTMLKDPRWYAVWGAEEFERITFAITTRLDGMRDSDDAISVSLTLLMRFWVHVRMLGAHLASSVCLPLLMWLDAMMLGLRSLGVFFVPLAPTWRSLCVTELVRRAPGFGNSTGGTPPDKVKERFELEKGAPKALLGTLENCTRDIAASNGSFDECKEQLKTVLQTLKNETLTDEEVEREIRKIAGEKAKHIVSTCSAAATTDAAKEACLSSAEAMQALATLTGRTLESIPEEELRLLFRKGAAEQVSEEVRLCMEAAESDTEKRACFSSDDIRDAIGESMGKGRGEVKDSDVRAYLEEGLKEEIWTMLEACPEDSKEQCMSAAKDMLAAVTGRPSSAITDDMIRQLLHDEMASELGERMRSCMDQAQDNTAKEACRTTLATEALGVARGTQGGGAPSRTDVEEALKEAGRDKAKEVSKDCQGSREECMERIRDEAAKSMGRSKEDLSDMEVERLVMDGARDAAKEAARACAEARKESNTATCADPTEVYASNRRMPIDDDVDRKRIKQDLVKESEKDAMRTCMEESDKTGFDRCMGELAEPDEVAGELFRGLSDERKQNKEKRAKEDAAVEVVGERFQICMEAATTEDEKKACHDAMRAGAGMAGLKEDVEDVVKKFQRSLAVLRTRETVRVVTIRSNDQGSNNPDDSSRTEDGSEQERQQRQEAATARPPVSVKQDTGYC